MSVYSSGKGPMENHRKDLRSYSFATLLGEGVKEKLYEQKTGNKQTCKKKKESIFHVFQIQLVASGGLKRENSKARPRRQVLDSVPFMLLLFLDALSSGGSINIVCRKEEKHHLQTVMNLKWKQATQLANTALKLHIKNIPSDKHFQGKQTKQKLKNLCGV